METSHQFLDLEDYPHRLRNPKHKAVGDNLAKLSLLHGSPGILVETLAADVFFEDHYWAMVIAASRSILAVCEHAHWGHLTT